MPLQEEEVRGTEKLSNFCQLLLQDKSLPKWCIYVNDNDMSKI
jgi:hypothetical protein